MDVRLNKEFHVLLPQLKCDDETREIIRFAIIIDSSKYQKVSWTLLEDDEAREAIRLLKIQIERLKKINHLTT